MEMWEYCADFEGATERAPEQIWQSLDAPARSVQSDPTSEPPMWRGFWRWWAARPEKSGLSRD